MATSLVKIFSLGRFARTVRNIFAIEELRRRIIYTLGLILVFRLGSFVLLPGLDYDAITAAADSQGGGGIFGFLDNLLGGAFSNKSILGLGIMPYITASIIFQLLGVAVPYFSRLQKEGESGRKRINQMTRIATVVICMAQAPGFIATIEPGAIVMDRSLFYPLAIILLSAGSLFAMWLGEKITERGIGNGISMLIMIGIISRLPAALGFEVADKGMAGALFLVLELIAFYFIVMMVVMVTQATRRIPVNYAKQVVGGRVYGGQRQYIPLKVNAAGVMPIIFAQSLMFIPPLIASMWEGSESAGFIRSVFSDQFSWQYNLVFALMIVLFTFFYTAITINPNQIADDLKRNGGFIPGVKPGQQTAEFIDTVLSRITLPGALFIALIAILPAFANIAGISQGFASFYGGTSLLILVGVVLDTLQQIESFLLMRQYEGMMKSGKLRGRSQDVAVAS